MLNYKKLIALFGLLVCTLGVVMCGGDEQIEDQPDPTPTATSVPMPTATATATPLPVPTPTPIIIEKIVEKIYIVVATPTPTTKAPEPTKAPTSPPLIETRVPNNAPPPTAATAVPPTIATAVPQEPAPTVTATSVPTTAPVSTPTPTPTATPIPLPTPTPTPTAVPTLRPTPTRIASTDASNAPPFPNTFKGNVYVGGELAPDGLEIFATTAGFQTQFEAVENGKYSLTVGPPSVSFFGSVIVFEALIDGTPVPALETSLFRAASISPPTYLINPLDLHFP